MKLRVVIAQSALTLNLCGSLSAAPLDFNRDVRPILADNCFECHGPDEEGRKGDLRLDTREGALRDEIIIPGKPEASAVIQRLITTDRDEVMPPPKSHRRPTAAQIETLKRWVAEGATYAQHWAYVPPQRRDLPEVSDAKWCRTPLDRLVLAKLDAEGLKPKPEAAPAVLARRLSLALTGLPPTVDELDAFVAAYQDDGEQAVSHWVDHLLWSERYGEHFAWSWLDAARYADTNGYQADGHRLMWRWRDWIIEALNENKRYDQLTLEMLAGDLLLPPQTQSWQTGDVIRDPQSLNLLTSTGFLRHHRYDTGSGTIPDESRFENAADRVETFSTIWLGMTMQCARCHDHKFDPISSRDYYSLLAFFDKIPEYGMAMRGASHPFIRSPTKEQRKSLTQLDDEVMAAETALAAAEPEMAAAQKAWEQTLTTAKAPPAVPFDSQRVSRGLKVRFFENQPAAFDGTQTKDLGNAANKLISGETRWTVSFWFRADGKGDATIFSNVDKPEATYTGLLADLAGDRLRLRHVCRWVNSYVEFISHETIRRGEWHCVTFSSDGRRQGLAYRATLDGQAGAMRLTEGATGDNIEDFLKGSLKAGGGPFLPNFHGSLADLRFYDRDLTAIETSFLAEKRSLAAMASLPSAQRSVNEKAFLRLHFMQTAASPKLRSLQQQKEMATAARETFIQTVPSVMVMQQSDGHQTHLHTKGAYDKLGEAVSPMTPSVLPKPDGDRLDRTQLARWLMRPDHPLTARVAVNRLWQQLWGRGLVNTPENFGTQAAQPLHHEALDWLATEYIRLGWDTKALIKLIVTSAVYRQCSPAPPSEWQSDPANQWLARGPRFRLPISVVRDSSLAISGLLEPQIGGPSVLLEKLYGQDKKEVKLPFSVNPQRRTLYTFWKRNAAHAMLAVFDVADRNQCDVRVRRTNTPLQALVTLNEPGQVACAQAFAKRITDHAEETDARLTFAFRAATGRSPGEAEMTQLRAAIAAYTEESRDASQAWSILANMLLNLDAALTLE